MQKTMKALVKKYAKPGLWMDEVPVPEIGINDVLVQIHKTAICGTDVHIWNWDAWSQKTIPVPMTIGHEFVGKVAVWAAMCMMSQSAIPFRARVILSAVAAATVWPGGGTSAKIPAGLA